jgi:hypothetical protein
MTKQAGYLGGLYIAKKDALVVNGTSYAYVADPDELDTATGDSLSLELWVSQVTADQTGASDLLFGKQSLADGDEGWGIYFGQPRAGVVDGSKLVYYANSGTTSDAVESTTSFSDGAWHHVLAVRDVSADQSLVYVDGELEASEVGLAGNLQNAVNLTLGSDMTGAAKVGLARVFSRAAQAGEASDLYSGRFPSDMVGHVSLEWGLWEGSGTRLYDEGPNDLTGVAPAASWTTETYSISSAEAVDTGDGATVRFSLDYDNVDWSSLAVTVDGVSKSLGKHYTATPGGTIIFDSNHVPAAAEAIVATYNYYPVCFEAGGFTNWSVDITTDMLDTTDFRSNGYREFARGMRTWTGNAERHWVNPLGIALNDEEVIVKLFFNDSTDDYLHGWAYVNGTNAAVAADGLVDEPISLQGNLELGTDAK